MTTEYVEPVPDYETEAGPTPRHEPEPEVVVPVRIVEGDARHEIRRHQYRAVRIIAADAGKVVNVIGKRDLRARLEIVNTHATDAVILLDNQTDSDWQGYRLAGGQKTELLHSEGPVFAVLPAAAVNDILLSVADEYSVMEQDED